MEKNCDQNCAECVKNKYVEVDPKEIISVFDRKQMEVFHGTKKQVLKFIAKTAKEYNYGLYRAWNSCGHTCYDCGPVTYHTSKIIQKIGE